MPADSAGGAAKNGAGPPYGAASREYADGRNTGCGMVCGLYHDVKMCAGGGPHSGGVGSLRVRGGGKARRAG